MNEAKVEETETKLSRTFHDYIDARKLYEEDIKKIHVYKWRIEELEAKAQGLEAEVIYLNEQLASV